MTATEQANNEREIMEAKVRELIDVVKMDVALDTEASDPFLYFNVTGEDTHFFKNNRGELLRNITYVLHTLHHALFPESRTEIKFDADHMLRDREDELRDTAMDALDEARETGREIPIGPFNPYERRVIHLAFRDKDGINTRSVGHGHQKKVLVSVTSSGDGEEE